MQKALFLALSGLGIAFAGMTPATATPQPEPKRSSSHAAPSRGGPALTTPPTRTPGALPAGAPARSSHHALKRKDCRYAEPQSEDEQ